ncbi:protein FIZZY-RELATED 2-like [Triticum urartu]|uniref:CDC20/Fizzy WD40 domain-containing protein n=2 Tax=Triticum TaxID=4564 RepID=A0A8R7QKU3_TRIUA|nr:protein FIZZY-RELATED 2-like [Triticum dicoccoides]XP_048532791.1 protein FIZZY-RELATED 2-like [Triticum urartu]
MDHHHQQGQPPSPADANSKPPTPSSTPASRHGSGSAPSWPPSSTEGAPARGPASSSASSAAPATPASRTVYSDRFIPSRTGSNLALFDLAPAPSSSASGSAAPPSPYCALLRAALFGPDTPDRLASSAGASSSSAASPVGSPAGGNIFRFKAEVPRNAKRALFAGGDDQDLLFPGIFTPKGSGPRKIPRSPYKVLDAPALQDDFYLNLVDWSSHNVLSVGLGNCVYLWNACSSKVTKLCDLGADDTVCSVSWAQRGTHLAVGTNQGTVQIWDATRCKRMRTMESHRMRVGALAWNSSLLSSGSRDKNILHHDLRAPEDYVSKLTGHKSEVCGLKWSYDNRQLASGGNDNKLFVWNQHSVQPVLKYTEHTAAVKAIAWSPHLHGLLASGGGTADRCIRFWNTTTNTHLSSMDTGSQVCNLVWSKNVNELVSTHGYSQNQIIVWRYPTMSKLATLTGHTFRVLYLAISPDGQTIVTGAGDETLRFWNVFPSPKSQSSDSLSSIGATSFVRSYIR